MINPRLASGKQSVWNEEEVTAFVKLIPSEEQRLYTVVMRPYSRAYELPEENNDAQKGVAYTR